MSLLEISHLTTKFETQQGTVSAVRDVSYHLEEGEVLGIVGESGSGKSVGMLTLMGLLASNGRVEEGEILFDGENISPPHTKDRKEKRAYEKKMQQIRGNRIGMIFQDAGASLCPIRTIGDQIYESMRAHKKVSRNEAKDRAMELFEKLNFKDSQRVWDSYPFELSGGMNQRAGIAISMLMNPPILLADEPTSALDVSVQRQVVREMLKLRELFGTAIIIVTHDIGVVRAMADTVLVLKNGKMVEYGEAKKVLNHPQDPYTKKLLAAVPRLKRKERS